MNFDCVDSAHKEEILISEFQQNQFIIVDATTGMQEMLASLCLVIQNCCQLSSQEQRYY